MFDEKTGRLTAHGRECLDELTAGWDMPEEFHDMTKPKCVKWLINNITLFKHEHDFEMVWFILGHELGDMKPDFSRGLTTWSRKRDREPGSVKV